MISSAKIQREIIKRNAQKSIPLLDSNFPQQCNFINDPAKLKALFCTRRSAKSYTAGLHMIKDANEVPNVNCLYIGLTRDSAKEIMWNDVLKDIDSKKRLGIKFNETSLTGRLKNGSQLRLIGVDSNEKEKNKALGKKYKTVIIDEAASFTTDQRLLVYGILKPAMADLRGTICMMGTSGNITKGLFFDITNGKEPGWSLHEWSAHDNPYVAKQWQEELDDIATSRPLFMDTPLFKQWYLNQWVVDDSKRVYKYCDNKNRYTVLPFYPKGDWTYILGVDLGYEDDSAFVVIAYHTFDKVLYIVEAYKEKHMDITDVSNKIHFYKKRFEISRVVVDGSSKQGVQEMQNRHGITLDPADKIGKVDFIEIMSAEFIQENIKLSPLCQALANEYLGLIWNDRSLKKEEHPNCDNHLCDAALYGWRFAYQYLSMRPKEKPKQGTAEWFADQEKLMIDRSLLPRKDPWSMG